jgi:ribose transport system substrate-binding protein
MWLRIGWARARQSRSQRLRQLKALHALALAALIVSACGSAGSSSSGGAKQVSISFVYSLRLLNAMQEMVMGARAAARDTPGVTFAATAPQETGINGPAEVKVFQTAARTAKDGIALVTPIPDVFINPLRQAHSSGIPIVAVDTPPPPDTDVGTFIGNSNFEVGQLLAREMLTQIPAGATGEVVVGNSLPGFAVLDQRIIGMLQVIRQQRPAVTIVGPFDSHITPSENLAAWTAEVAQHPHALAYISPADLDAVSLAQIQVQTGRHLLVGGCDLEADGLQAIKNGYVYALASPEHWLKGYISVKLLAEHAQSGRALPTGWWNPGALVVDRSNVDDIIARQHNEASRTSWFRTVVDKQFSNQSQYVKPLSAAT